METREYNGIDFKIIEGEDLAAYLEKVYNNQSFRDFLLSRKNKAMCQYETDRLGDMLAKYYIATGDDRDETIDRIVESYASHPVDFRKVSGSNDIKFHVFRHGVYPFIIDYWKKELGKDELSFSDLKEILTIISTQSTINRFETHSFNGALKSVVDREGLNIHNEMFRDNYELLSHISSSPYSVGELCLCNLSTGTFGYTHRSPERLWMTIGTSQEVREECENDNEYGKRMLDDMLSRYVGVYDEKFLTAARSAGEEMVDFYTKSDEVCVAICRMGGEPDIEKEYKYYEESLTRKLKYSFQLPYSMQRSFPRELVSRLNGAALKGQASIDEIEQIIEEMKLASPEKAEMLDEFIANVFSANMATYGVSNYMHEGNNDGYIVPGGKLPRESFALATVRDPVKDYSKDKKIVVDPKR